MPEVTNDTKVTIELTVLELNYIITALQELPAKICNPIHNKISEQYIQQTQELKK